MKIIKKLYLSFELSLVTVLLICLPKTNAKFLYENYGIAWDNHFTSFSQLKEVFYIEEPNGEDVNELWGGIKDGSVNGHSISNTPLKDGEDWYSFGKFPSDTTITEDQIRSNFSNYLIENLKNIEINAVNQTTERMVVCFKIYYYAPSLRDVSTHISFGIYNTILHKNDTSKSDCSLLGELVANIESGDYSNGQYDGLVEVPTERLSGNDNSQFIGVEGGWFGSGKVWYYPHRITINPYEIIYDAGTPICTGHHDLTVNKNWLGNVTSIDDNGPATYKYPAVDYNNSNSKADDIMSGVDLEDFILDPSESGSFNLSLYFGNYGNTTGQSNSASFVTSLALIARPESEVLAEMEAAHNNLHCSG